MSTTRDNWKKHKAKQASFTRQAPEQLAMRRSREQARALRRRYEEGHISSMSWMMQMAMELESKELRGSLAHEAIKIVLEAEAAKAGGHE